MLDKRTGKIAAMRLTLLSVVFWLSNSAIAQDGTSLIGHWTLDNGANDTVGAYDGQLIGIGTGNTALPVAVSGKNGQAMEFNGGTGVEIPIDLDYRTHSALTVTMWVRLGETPRAAGTQTLISTGAGDGPRIELARNQVRASAGGRVLGPKYALIPGEWSFVAVSWDHAAGSMSMTVNNSHAFYPLGYEAKRSQQTYVSPRDPDLEKYGRKGAQKRYLWIGAKDGFGKSSSLKDVAIDDVRVYSGVLAGEQLVELSGGISNGTYIPAELRGIASTWASVINHEEQYSAPDIGDGTGEVGALPELFGDPDMPPDIGDGTGAANAEQRVMMGQADSLPGNGSLNGSSGTPTSVLPGGSRSTDLSADESLQQAIDENAPPDITYDSEAEAIAAAEAADARRAREEYQQELSRQQNDLEQQRRDAEASAQEQSEPPVYGPGGDFVLSGVTGYSGGYGEKLDHVGKFFTRIGWSERNDRPCMLNASLRGGLTSSSRGDLIFDSCQESLFDSWPDLKSVGGLGPIRSLRVCNNNNNNHRMKGIQIWGARIDSRGNKISQPEFTYASRPNCAEWGRVVHCPSGTLATGLFIHSNAAGSVKQIVGLELMCRAIVQTN